MAGTILNSNIVNYGGLIEVTPTNNPAIDIANVQLAIDIAPTGTLISLMPGIFNFGTGTITSSINGLISAETSSRGGVVVNKGLNINGSGVSSTIILGGIGQNLENLSGVFQLYFENLSTKQKIEISNITFSGSANAIGIVRPNQDIVHQGKDQSILLHNIDIINPIPILKPDNFGEQEANVYFSGITGYGGGESLIHINSVNINMTNIPSSLLEGHIQTNGGAIELRTMLGPSIIENVTTTGSNAKFMITNHVDAADTAVNEIVRVTNDYHLPSNNLLGSSLIAIPYGRMSVKDNTFRIRLTSGSHEPSITFGMCGLGNHKNNFIMNNRFESFNPDCTSSILNFKSSNNLHVYANMINGLLHPSGSHISIDGQGDFVSSKTIFKRNIFSGSSGRVYNLRNGKKASDLIIASDELSNFTLRNGNMPYFVGSGSVGNNIILTGEGVSNLIPSPNSSSANSSSSGLVEYGDPELGPSSNRIRR